MLLLTAAVLHARLWQLGLMLLDHAKRDPNTYSDLIIMQKLLLVQLEESAKEILL